MMNTPEIVLELKGVHRHFGTKRKPKRILGPINIEISRGEFVGVIGKSGSGKTTLLNMIFGKLRPTIGTANVASPNGLKPIRDLGRDRLIVYQNETLLDHLTAIENVAIGPLLAETSIPLRMLLRAKSQWRDTYRAFIARAEAILVELGLQDELHQYPRQLSGGQQRRVALAAGIIMEPEILMLDEPFKGLDGGTRSEVHNILLRLYKKNQAAVACGQKPPLTLIMIDHYNEDLVVCANRVLAISPKWDWQTAGFAQFPGATIVYDKPAPIFEISNRSSAADVEMQAKEMDDVLSRTIFDPQTERTYQVNQHRLNPKEC